MVKENDIITDGTTKWKVRRLGGRSSDGDGNPVGTIIMYAANTMPEGYLLCDGSAVSRTDYAELFKVIGTTWGAGDGSTTFNLPNAVGRFPEGSATAGGYIEAGLPNIYGSMDTPYTSLALAYYDDSNCGALRMLSKNLPTAGGGSGYNASRGIVVDASLSNAIYGNSSTVQPSTFITKYIIKYI